MKKYAKPEIEVVSLMQDESIAADLSGKETTIEATGILTDKGLWDE